MSINKVRKGLYKTARILGNIKVHMKSIKRKAQEGEKIVLTDPQKAFNGPEDYKGLVLSVIDVREGGVYTKEAWPTYISDEGYEVLI